MRQTNDPAIASAQRRDKQRQEAQQTARENRYRVVNCLRTTLHDTATETDTIDAATKEQATTDNRQITIVDIESQQHQQTHPQQLQQPADSDIGYVYDLYVPENEIQAAYVDMMDDNYLRFVLHIEEQQLFNITNFYM